MVNNQANSKDEPESVTNLALKVPGPVGHQMGTNLEGVGIGKESLEEIKSTDSLVVINKSREKGGLTDADMLENQVIFDNDTLFKFLSLEIGLPPTTKDYLVDGLLIAKKDGNSYPAQNTGRWRKIEREGWTTPDIYDKGVKTRKHMSLDSATVQQGKIKKRKENPHLSFTNPTNVEEIGNCETYQEQVRLNSEVVFGAIVGNGCFEFSGDVKGVPVKKSRLGIWFQERLLQMLI
ncbi:hypothetical protein QYF36_019167 [Acer negundo]|nr:hypothetical protein QYF36_019167 [Acer negundo]